MTPTISLSWKNMTEILIDNEWGVLIYSLSSSIEIHLSFPFSQNIYSSIHQLYKKL